MLKAVTDGAGLAMGSNAFLRFLGAVTAVALTGAAAGGIVLTLQAGAAPNDVVEYAVGRVSGTIVLESVWDPGPAPFTDPIAVDLDLDPLLLPLPPLNAAEIDSPHRRGSAADLLAAGAFGHRMVDLDRSGADLTVRVVDKVAHDTLGLDAVVEDLTDTNGDDVDDDGRLTLRALDGSAVCVRLPEERSLAAASGAQADGAIPVSGYWWSPYGPCGSPESAQTGSDVKVGTTPGVYGAVSTGEVCDIGLLAQALDESDTLTEAWTKVLGVEPDAVTGFLEGLTAVVVLRDTTVTDHLLEGGRITARVAVLERGTAVLVDETGLPRVRCISGSPLRTASPVPSGVVVEGQPWHGFSLEQVQTLPAAMRATREFVLVDLATGSGMRRAPGIVGALTRLAGPLYAPTNG